MIASIGIYFWKAKSWQFWGGGMLFLAVSLTPLVVYSLLDFLRLAIDMEFPSNFQALICDQWVLTEAKTILVASVAIYFIRFPPLSIPLYLSLWLLSFDMISFLQLSLGMPVKPPEIPSVCFGLAVMATVLTLQFFNQCAIK
jgi:hypothetical protein